MSLKIYFCGYGGNAYLAEELRPIIEDLGLNLITIHEHDNADIKWDKDTWLEHLKKADIIIAPANYKIQPAKSANRLTQAMSLGKPVVCSPLPAYLDVGKKYPGSFLIADSPEEWKERLMLLRDTPMFRQQLGERALKASQDYSLDAMGQKWVLLLKEIKLSKKEIVKELPSEPSFEFEINPANPNAVLKPIQESVQEIQDSVDIIIPTYKNLRGLKLCINSIRECTTIPYRIIVINNGVSEEMHQYLKSQKDIDYKKIEKTTFAKAVNTGLRAMTSKYAMILNDDVIVSRGWLKTMIKVCTSEIGAVGPLSNCDKGWLHNYNINIGNIELLPGINTFEQIEPIISQIYEYKSPYSGITERDWIAFYATLIPREVIMKVGILDEKFENSGEDSDYCYRIRKLGYKIIQAFESFVFHFGAVSRKILEKENYEEYHLMDKRTISYLNLKYQQPLVVFYSGPSWEKWDFRNLEQGGIGGSEVWQINLSRELSKLNYRVINFCDCEKEILDNDIKWLPFNQYNSFIEQNYIDFFISSRTTDPFLYPLRVGKTFVQIHDVWMLSHRDQILLDKITKFCALSQWHLDFASDYHKIPKSQMTITANGINFDRFDNIKTERNPYRLHWSSSWDRGLDNVLYLFPFIKEKIPQLELHIFYGIYNWKQSCLKKNDQKGLEKISELEKAISQPGIFSYGRINQKKLAEEWCKASLWLYPAWFSESFCITAIEGQRAGVPVIANKYAGLVSTLGDSAILLGNGDPWWPYSKEGREKFLEETISILTDKDKWQYWSEKGFKNTEKYSWAQVAQMWKKLFEE